MNDPKFLLGESYGTFRNAGVMDKLLSQGIELNGVIMVSAVFDIRSLAFPKGEDISYLVHFPTYAATAWYHDKIDKSAGNLDNFIEKVRAFTEQEYLSALFQGERISPSKKQAIADQLEQFTGVKACLLYTSPSPRDRG